MVNGKEARNRDKTLKEVYRTCGISLAKDGTFGYDFQGAMAKKLRNAKDNITQTLCDRLEWVTIESRDAIEVIKTYDSPDTFHFVDPPYLGTDCAHYNGTFNEHDMGRLLAVLEKVKGKFMLTTFPLSQVQDYANLNGWKIHRIERHISASKTKRRRQEEWMVCNY